MQFNRLIIALFLIIVISKVNAQKFELGKVSTQELQEKTHPLDTSAVAAILYNKARTSFVYNDKKGFTAVHEFEFRIKIYKKEGLKWANHQVPYYVGYENLDDDVVKFLNGTTYNLENGKIIKTKLNNEGSFKNNVNEYWKEASIAMPNVKVGSVIEFKYVLKSENLIEFPVFNFQHDIPVNYSVYTTEIPAVYVYRPLFLGLIQIRTDQKLVNGFSSYQNEYNQLANLTFEQINSTYITENIPSLKEENYVDNIQNYRSSIHHELEKIRYPDQPDKNYSQTWEGVARTIFKEKDFGKELNERLYIENDLKRILKSTTTESEKANVIFDFVQNKMNWNKHSGYLTDKGVKQAYIDNIGNVADINFILIAMLNSAGINSYPVLISTKEHGIPLSPSRTVFNHVIAFANVDGKQILFDATNKHTTTNILPLNTLNWTGRLIRQDGTSEEINLVPKTSSKETINMIVTIDGTGKITGQSRIQKTDYEAFSFREKNEGINKEDYLEKLENNRNGIQISDYTIQNSVDLAKPIIESFTFVSDNHCEIIADKMFINPMLFFTQTKNPFVQDTRDLPIYFGYPKQEKYNITIEIPKGYVVESIPNPIKIVTGENIGLFTFNILKEGNKIQVAFTKEINSSIIPASFYNILKDFFQQMIEKQNEKIVLKKV